MPDIQAVFLDRDGTIGGTGHFIHPKNFTLYDGAQDAIHKLKNAGIKVLAFTNQHRISKGQATLEDFRKQFHEYGFDDSYICPHGSHESCSCRKPSPQLLQKAAAQYGLDLSRCVVVGDVGDTDLLAAHAVGAMKILVRTGWGEGSLHEYRYKWEQVTPDYIAENVMDAVEWILTKEVECNETDSVERNGGSS